MVQSEEDNLDSSETTASISYISTSSASSRAHPRTSLFLENLHDANDDFNAEQMAMATVSYENTSRGEGFTVYINNERYSRIMSASTSSSSSIKSSPIAQFRTIQDHNVPTNTVDPVWLRRVNEESSPTRNATPSQTVTVRPERALNSPSSQRLSCALTISTSVLMGEDIEESPLERESNRAVSSIYSSLVIRGNDEPKSGTPRRPTPTFQPNETMENSFLSYQYDETLEPSVAEAVKLTKNRNPDVNYISSRSGEGQNENQSQYELTDESKFIPHKFKIPEKTASIVSSASDEFNSPGAPNTATRAMKIPQSPSLIGNLLIPLHNSDSSNGSSPSDCRGPSRENIFRSKSTYNTSSSLEEEGPPIGVPSIPVLRSVSGPSRWGKTPLRVDSGRSTKSEPFSPYGGPKTPSPLSKVNNKRKGASEHEHFIVLAPIKSQSTQQLVDEKPIIEIPGRSVRREIQEKTDTTKRDGGGVEDMDLEARMPIQHIDTASIHSFDSGQSGFKDVYSVGSIVMVIICCIVVPPLFFIIGCGPRSKMVSDYRLMRLIMNKEHRVALLQGFIWDVDLRWFRTLCLILGAAETMMVMAGIAIGFGVGITQE
ncbi:Bud8p [Saccharomyces eubayanus]|uniref:Bud8p n=1 Tax=Saccharomyces eubayanus TaxID=1080349 RepID=UPI0006BEFE1C|nr:BUD8-like protein [Saccharomyces eubayanus]KOG98025.1 BUD8-like protein [Saccharomyces eubayanus]